MVRGLLTRLWRYRYFVAAAAVGVVAVIVAAVISNQPRSAAGDSGGFPGVSAKLANDMSLTSLPDGNNAPSFTLTDQYGHRVDLSSLRHKVVVLTFMDSHCTDICPLVSQEFVDAYLNLGASRGRVVFVAVNVNQYHAGLGDVASFSSDHQLDSIPSWHFVTGSTAAMSAVWQGYGVTVQAPNPNADIVHTSVIYFIDANGVERYAAVPQSDKAANGTTYLPVTQLADWGQGIAGVARYLATH